MQSNSRCLRTFLKLAACIFLQFFLSSQVTYADERFLKPGLWEGVNQRSGHYNLLEISSTGNHRLHRVFLNGKLQLQQFSFNEKQLECEKGQCKFCISDTGWEKTQHFLLSSGYQGFSVTVLETIRDKNDEVILSDSFSLRRKKGESSFRSFLNRYKTKISNSSEVDNGTLSGLWIGTLTQRTSGSDLLVLDATEASMHTLVKYALGMSITNETTFSPGDITKKGDALHIETSHLMFASRILLHKRHETLIEGHIYSYANNQLLETGSFTLTKVEL